MSPGRCLPRRTVLRRLARGVGVTLAATGLVASAAVPAGAANRATPRSFTGYGFDQCLAPTQRAMDAWL
jgi:hypothetical protein